jgi:hypothetical protein
MQDLLLAEDFLCSGALNRRSFERGLSARADHSFGRLMRSDVTKRLNDLVENYRDYFSSKSDSGTNDLRFLVKVPANTQRGIW